ncbi:MAG TPA: SET domain-containing protein-lysine N-methyltransferase [Candidatus Acidoferrales bacterium]|nr:SET domain-containing protein-lysine N-methyltransferase [Candidatus Acidoferrales bacterium]
MQPKSAKVPAIDSQFARFDLRVRRSRIQGWGVYAAQPIPRGRLVIEYTGERLSPKQALRRLRKTCLNPRTRKLTMFRLNRYWRIDGAVGGSGAERINHCCNPNLKVRITGGRILFFSKRRIRPNEELSIDYGLSAKTFILPCHCGAKNCRGTVNRKE